MQSMCFRCVLYRGLTGELPDLASHSIGAAYVTFPPETTPVLTNMGIVTGTPMADSVFGNVQAGSVFSYQHPPAVSDSHQP